MFTTSAVDIRFIFVVQHLQNGPESAKSEKSSETQSGNG